MNEIKMGHNVLTAELFTNLIRGNHVTAGSVIVAHTLLNIGQCCTKTY